jgi:hypothetical protein
MRRSVVAGTLVANVTVPVVVPNVVPAIVTGSPRAAALGVIPVMRGRAVNATPLLGTPPTVTTTGPLPSGTAAGTVA